MRSRLAGVPLLVAGALAVTIGTGPAGFDAAAQLPAPQTPVERIEFEPGQRIDSAVCGSCHVDIYDQWRASVHADSYRDPVFQAGLARAIGDAGPEIAVTCLTCHSPATMLLEKARPEQPMEGVSCQFCHVLRGAHPGSFPPFDIDRELVMYGSIDAAESPVHGAVYSPFMETAAYCATCHEFTGPSGAHVLSTFTEYATGSYPPLTQCQGCHMPLVPGTVVSAAVQPASEEFVHSHAMRGGRDIGQLRRAVAVEIDSIERRGGAVAVTVGIENRAAGHWIPTGMPSRRFVLEVASERGDDRSSHSVVFGRRIVDGDGRSIRELARMILQGTRVVADTRLRPRQRRTFDFTLPAPVGVESRLVVRLYYESSEMPEKPPVTEDVVRIERSVE